MNEFLENFENSISSEYLDEIEDKQILKEAIINEFINQELVSEKEHLENLELLKNNKLIETENLEKDEFHKFLDKSDMSRDVSDYLGKESMKYFDYKIENEKETDLFDSKKLSDE